MFKKALKYDMASVKRYWWMIAVIILAMSVVGSIVFRGVCYIIEYASDSLWIFAASIGILFLFVCVMAAFSSVIVTTVLTQLRYYRNFFTDEGYLTFTLPVSRKTLYLSKTVNSMLWSIAHILLLLAAIVIVITLAPIPEDGSLLNFFVWEKLGEVFCVLWDEIGAWIFLYAVELIVLYVCSVALSVGLVQLCITIGSILAKKHKLLASIGVYYAVNVVTSTVTQLVLPFFAMFMAAGLSILFERVSIGVQHCVVALGLLLIVLALAAVALVLHFVTLGLLERKLNLA